MSPEYLTPRFMQPYQPVSQETCLKKLPSGTSTNSAKGTFKVTLPVRIFKYAKFLTIPVSLLRMEPAFHRIMERKRTT